MTSIHTRRPATDSAGFSAADLEHASRVGLSVTGGGWAQSLPAGCGVPSWLTSAVNGRMQHEPTSEGPVLFRTHQLVDEWFALQDAHPAELSVTVHNHPNTDRVRGLIRAIRDRGGVADADVWVFGDGTTYTARFHLIYGIFPIPTPVAGWPAGFWVGRDLRTLGFEPRPVAER
ncbi:hypothetical protein ACIRCZ_18650 [Leifsonia sp. NPDC102414]|uniref:hypothetical protein n=1 Tax=Leifsonia sp. NPDC102414 TaxID=3364124 RepID=UPI003803EB3E